MPTRIIHSDRADVIRSEYWIEKPFVTIGSGERSDVRLADVADAEVYVQFRDGTYTVFNKSAGEMLLDGRPLAGGASRPWPPAAELVIGADHRLRLEVAGDPAPSPRPLVKAVQPRERSRRAGATTASAGGPEPAADAATPRVQSSVGVRVGQLVVTLVCVGAAALMLGGGLEAPVSAAKGGRDFDAAIDEIMADKATPKNERARLAFRMRAAEAAFRQRDVTTARQRYGRIRRWVDAQAAQPADSHAGGPTSAREPESLLRLVNARLAAIAGMEQ